MSEKKRGQNFTEKEVQILIKICNKFKKIIECKKTDAFTNKEKDETWKKIMKDFHALTMDSSRSVKQLQEKYKAVKKRIKADYSKNLTYTKGTGGGPYIPPPTPKTEEEKELLETIKLSVEGLTNPFDNDGMSGMQAIPPQTVLSHEVSDDDVMVDVDWTSGNAALWQTPKHPALKLAQKCQTDTDIQRMPLQVEIFHDPSDNDEGMVDVNCASGSTALMQTPEHSDLKLQTNTGTPSLQLPLPVVLTEEKTTQDHETKQNMVSRKIDDKMVSGNITRKWQTRRAVLNKKKTVSSAGAKFHLMAEKKLELIECQKLVAETQLKQIKEEHAVKMELFELKKQKESLKCKLLEEGKLVFEF